VPASDVADRVHAAASLSAYPAARMPAYCTASLPASDIAASMSAADVGDRLYAATGLSAKRAHLPDAECGEPMRRVHAVRPLAIPGGGAVRRRSLGRRRQALRHARMSLRRTMTKPMSFRAGGSNRNSTPNRPDFRRPGSWCR
jgi:hypothetical protein